MLLCLFHNHSVHDWADLGVEVATKLTSYKWSGFEGALAGTIADYLIRVFVQHCSHVSRNRAIVVADGFVQLHNNERVSPCPP